MPQALLSLVSWFRRKPVEEVLYLAPGVAQALIEAMREKGGPLPQALQSVEPPFHTELLVPV